MRVGLKTLLLLVSPLVLLIAAAYIQWGAVGLPTLSPSQVLTTATAVEPYGFPAWLRIAHYVNFFFLILLIRSDLQILMDHPRLYWNAHCTPGTEWLRFTPIEPPKDGTWTSKDDSRHLSPWIGLAAYLRCCGSMRALQPHPVDGGRLHEASPKIHRMGFPIGLDTVADFRL